MYFYPAAMTPGCTTEACDFRDNLNSLESAGYQVIGISKDEPAANAQFAEQESLNFPLLSDPTLEVHRAYSAFGEKSLYGKTVEGTIRSTFVVDEHGRDQPAALQREGERARREPPQEARHRLISPNPALRAVASRTGRVNSRTTASAAGTIAATANAGCAPWPCRA